MRLPNADRAIIEVSKLGEYILSLHHVTGKAKAAFFIQYGFSPERPDELRDALFRHGHEQEVADVTETEYGPRYAVEGTLESPDGRNPRVRSVWQIDNGTDFPRLITVIPN